MTKKNGSKRLKAKIFPLLCLNLSWPKKHIHIFLLGLHCVELHEMLWLQGQTISAGTKSAACRHLAHMGRLSRQLNQHRGISSGRNVRDADGSDASPLPRALRQHLRVHQWPPYLHVCLRGVFYLFFARLWAFIPAAVSVFCSTSCVQVQS